MVDDGRGTGRGFGALGEVVTDAEEGSKKSSNVPQALPSLPPPTSPLPSPRTPRPGIGTPSANAGRVLVGSPPPAGTGKVTLTSEPVLAFVATPSKETAYVGEEVTIAYELVTDTELQGIEYVEAPQFPGLRVADLERPERPQGRRDTWEGRPVARFTLLKKTVSGLTPGTVTIPPAKIRITVRVPMDPLGNPLSMLSPRAVECETKPIPLEVLPIPDNAEPHGPVGQVGVSASVDRKGVSAGAGVTAAQATAMGIGILVGILVLVMILGSVGRERSASDRTPAPAGPAEPIRFEPVVSPEPHPVPASGVMYTYGSFGGPNRRLEAPFEIKAGQGSHFLVKLVHVGTNQPAMTIFVRSGETVEAEVPLGTFEVRYASGDTWYGDDLLFGPETSYSKADTPFTFEIVGNQVQGFTITLYTVANGNLSTKAIGASEF